jgi:putative endonuclease
MTRRQRGTTAYHAGLAAEDGVADFYGRSGRVVIARRWRGRGGEIDVIANDGDATVFVEVKRARTHAIAAERVTPRQRERILASASEYMDRLPAGQNSHVRFDVALVDEVGRIEVIENALGA